MRVSVNKLNLVPKHIMRFDFVIVVCPCEAPYASNNYIDVYMI